MSQRSLQDIIRQQESQRESRRLAEIQRELIRSEQRERARQEYLRRNQLLERVGFAPTTPSPGAGGGSTITQIGSTYWALLFSPDSVSGQNYTPQSMGRDSNGNIYVGSIDSSNAQKSIIRKLSTSGNIIWEKTLFNSNINSDMELSRILVLPNSQGVVCLYKSGLRKLDTNGNISWTFIHNISTDTLNLTSCVLNLVGDAIYVFGTKDNDTSFELAQFDLSTGAVSNNKLLIVDGSFFCKAYADIGLDSSGNILIPLANATVPPFYNTTVIKVEPLISTGGASIIGTWTLLESSYGNNRQDVAALAVDSSNSVILHGYSRGITKIAADLDGAIAVTLDIVLGSEAWDSSSLAVSSDDSIFVVGDYGPKLKIVKLSSNLLPQFSYTIESLSGSLSLQGWWSANANSSIEIVDDIMLITAGYNSGLGVQELLLKLPLTNMSGFPEYGDRTYGDFKFTNHPITQDNVSITTTIVNPITTDSTWIVEDTGLEASLTQPANSQTITETSLD